MANPVLCTPAALVKVHPCLACLSEHDLKAALVYVLAKEFGGSLDLTVLLSDAACLRCFTNKDFLKFEIGRLLTIFDPTANKTTLSAASKCFKCLSPHQLDTLIFSLRCKILST